MITYDPGKWFGFHKLIQIRGSVTPDVMPHCLFSTALVLWVHYADLVFFPRSPYAHQIFTFGLSFLVIMRTNLSYSRYWEGISELVAMHSKWTDAVSQIIAFDELSSGNAATAGDKFRNHVVHIMSLMSAAIVLKFQEGGLDELDIQVVKFQVPGLPMLHNLKTNGTGVSAPSTPSSGRSIATVVPGVQAESPAEAEPDAAGGKDRVAPAERAPPAERSAVADGVRADDLYDAMDGDGDDSEIMLPVIDGTDEKETTALKHAASEGCPVHFLMQKLVRLVARRHKAGGLAAPPPIVSRIFQELSNGFLAFQGANKVATIPFPFPYAQIVQYLQLAFVLSCPFVVVAFVDDLSFQMFFTFLGVFTFCSLNAVASQLEDPFGHDANDLPLRQLHHHFVCNLSQLQRSKLSEADEWCITEEVPVDTKAPEGTPAADSQSAVEASFDEGAARLAEAVNKQVAGSGGVVLHEAALKEMFDSLDKNGNGVLDHDELKVLCSRIGLGYSDEKMVSMLKKVDPEASGEVRFDTVWNWFMKKHRKATKKAAKKNGGELSPIASPGSPLTSPRITAGST